MGQADAAGRSRHRRREIRRVPSIDEFPQDNPWIQRERAWREADRAAADGRGGRRGGVADRVRPHRRHPRPLHRRLRARRGPRPGGVRRGARHLAARRRAARTRRAGCSTVGRRRAIDAFRRRAALDERYAALARDQDEAVGSDVLWDPDEIDDDVLALMFISCHPVLSPGGPGRADASAWSAASPATRSPAAFLVPTADGAGADHPGEEDARRGAGAVRAAVARGAPRAARLGAQRALRDLHRGLDRHVGRPS